MTGQPTLHFAVVRALGRFYGSPNTASIAQRDSLSSRRDTLYIINAAWCLTGFGCTVAMLVIGIPVRELAGEAEGNTGRGDPARGALLLHRRLRARPATLLLVPAQGAPSPPRGRPRGYENYMARALPRNSSVVFQTAVGVLTVLATGTL